MSDRARSLASVDFNLLKALDALLQESSVTRAAERLSITQPSMSSTLRRLRELFADELLIRTGRTMRPTPLAEALQPRVRRIVADIEDIVVSTTDFAPECADRSFRILATDYASLVLVQPLMAALATEAPNVRIHLQPRAITEHAALLQRGEIDLAIIPSDHALAAGVPHETLFTDRFVAAVWRHNPDIEEPLTFAQLDCLPYLSYTVGPVDSLLRDLGHPRAPDAIVESFVLGPLLLRGTRQITFVQERLAHQLAATAELRLLEPPFDSPALVETMAWHPRAGNDPAHSWLRARLRTIAQQL
jgi:LysR family transcriptional regulator, nod-box dependent transcriptional activator